jgi:hypothetical protein
MIKLKSILNEIENSNNIVKIDDIKYTKVHGKSLKGIDSYYSPINKNEFTDYVKSNFIDINGYRAIDDRFEFKNANNSPANNLIVYPKHDFAQTSVDSHSFYYALLDNLDNWKTINEFEHGQLRSKSIKFSNNQFKVEDDYLRSSNSIMYRIYPKKDASILCAMYENSFMKFPHLFKIVGKPSFDSALKEVVDFINAVLTVVHEYTNDHIKLDDRLSIQQSEHVLDFIRTLKSLTESQVDNIIRISKSIDIIDHLVDHCNNNVYKLLEDLFDPEKNGVRLLKADSQAFREILEYDDDVYELWTSDMCYCEIETVVESDKKQIHYVQGIFNTKDYSI